jgi:hypothetical protein
MREYKNIPEQNGNSKTQYSGKMSEYQTNGTRYFNHSLTHYQKSLYEQTVFGIKGMSPDQVRSLSKEERIIIHETHKKCQQILNQWKQEIVNEISNQLFKKYFPKSPFTQTLTEKYPNVTDDGLVNTIPFKLLGIKRTDIINKLIKSGILPNDFYQKKSKYSNLKL